jgi:hypothetical protein
MRFARILSGLGYSLVAGRKKAVRLSLLVHWSVGLFDRWGLLRLRLADCRPLIADRFLASNKPIYVASKVNTYFP